MPLLDCIGNFEQQIKKSQNICFGTFSFDLFLFKIREITNFYTAPETACTTHRIMLDELKAFEEDLHQHVHLENNILFPMAINN